MVKRSSVFLLSIMTILLHDISVADSGADDGIPEEITAVFPTNFLPHYSLTDKGEPSGFAVELLNEVAERAGLEVHYRSTDTWQEAHQIFQNGDVHVLPNLAVSDRRKEYANFTRPIDTVRIFVFVRYDDIRFRNIGDLVNYEVGMLKSSLATRELEKLARINIQFFDYPQDMFDALDQGRIDALAYSESVIWRDAPPDIHVGAIRKLEPPLRETTRAIAVRKDLSALHRILDQELKLFVATPKFDEIYRKWHVDSSSGFEIRSDYTFLILVLLAIILIPTISVYRRKIQSSIRGTPTASEKIDDRLGSKRRIISLLLVMTIVAVSVLVAAITILYQSTMEETGKRLSEMARVQAHLMESMARFNQQFEWDNQEDALQATISEIRAGLAPLSGSAEITLGRLDGDNIVFLLRQKSSLRYEPAPVPLSSPIAEPMRKALSGRSGILTGRDYRGQEVLAAYEWVSVLNFGVVVKMDLEQIRAPFILAATFTGGVGIFIILFGVIVFYRISNPILKRLATEELRLLTILDTVPIGISITHTSDGLIRYANPAAEDMFGTPENSFVGSDTSTMVSPDDQKPIMTALQNKGEINNHELVATTLDGTKIPISISARFATLGDEKVIITAIFDMTERKRFEEQLLQGEVRLLRAEQFAHFGHWQFSVFDRVLYSSDEVYRIYGRDPKTYELTLDNGIQAYHPDDREFVTNKIETAIETGEGFDFERRIIRPDGVIRDVHAKGQCECDLDGQVVSLFGVIQDITDQKRGAELLRQSQKMDAVGQLTGGIAHDFNNILGIIMGNLELLRNEVHGNVSAIKHIDVAYSGAERGANITKKLLSFSKGEGGDPQLTNVNNFISGMHNLIKKSLTPKVTVETHLADDIWMANIDPGDFENALLNLALNAGDSMPDGGTLVFETSNKVLDEQYVQMNPGTETGEFVQISASDTGCGMTPEVMSQVFQPFYSTKEVGHGTGLGLSMVYGFVQRSHGHIKVYSEPGMGSTFRIFLPRAADAEDDNTSTRTEFAEKIPRGDETVLIVDDEAALVKIAVLYLNNLGYRTHTATDGREALQILQEYDQIDFLFSDIVMPGGMDGYNLAKEALKIRPNLKVLLTSGFTAERENAVNGDVALFAKLTKDLLDKPYNRRELGEAVRRILDREN